MLTFAKGFWLIGPVPVCGGFGFEVKGMNLCGHLVSTGHELCASTCSGCWWAERKVDIDRHEQ